MNRTKIGMFIKQENGTISFVYDDGKGQMNDCQALLAYAHTTFKEVENKTLKVTLDIEVINN